MSSRVTPFQTSFLENQEIPTSVTVPNVTSDIPFNYENQEQENARESLLKAVEEVYSPLLRAMKIFGIYFGDDTLNLFRDTSSPYRIRHDRTRNYCCGLASGFWFNFILASTALVFDNDIYIVLMMNFWCLFIALNATISLVVLPITGAKKSRLENFFRFLLATVKTANLEKLKKSSRTALSVFCALFMLATAGILVGALVLTNFSIGTFKPWHEWLGFRIFSTTFLIIGVGSWLLPIIFFCITSLMLETIFDDLHRSMSSSQSTPMNLAAFKIEYHQLCGVVELADKVLAPLLLVFISVYIPLLCFSFYNVVNLKEHNSLLFLLGNLSWMLIVAVVLGLILFFGGKVNEDRKSVV